MASYFQFADLANRQVGLQVATVNTTLWLYGGHYLNPDGLVNDSIVPKLGSVDLNTCFEVPPGPNVTWYSMPRGPPHTAHGYMFSNLANRAWLFGGRSIWDPSPPNTVWSFEPNNSTNAWTLIDVGGNITQQRPAHGAGCNVPTLQRGYYLGGATASSVNGDGDDHVSTEASAGYLHVMHVFDTQTEIMSVFPVPDFVPVVNQSMVWLDTGNMHGALAVLGGYTERNNTLDIVPLTSVFLYDIANHMWFQQNVTDTQGGVTESLKQPAEPAVGIPRRRYNACVTVGTSLDKSSHNIYLLSGENGTYTQSDAWILSLPSCVWIKAPMPDLTNGPMADSSCTNLGKRYTLMFGGCFHDQNPDRPCMSYSYNPLNYNIAINDWSPYANDSGYFVYKNVSQIIGGRSDGLGGSPHSSPMFGNFSDPMLKNLFMPPPHRFETPGINFYDSLSHMLVPLLVGLPVVLSVLLLPTTTWRDIRKRCSLNPSTASTNRHITRSWKPWVLKTPYLVILNVTTSCLIALIICLKDQSETPDPDPQHWTGCPDSDGIWLGERFHSIFIPAPGSKQPPQGLMSTYFDAGTTGTYNQKNFTIRFYFDAYWAFTYLPMLIAVLYGRMWKLLDDELKRLDKFYRLRGKGGTTGKRSLCLDYHSFWIPLSIIQALRYRHWSVAVSSTGAVLGGIILPVVQNYVFIWVIYSGGQLAWPATFSWGVAIIDPYWWKPLIALLCVSCLCSMALLFLLPLQDSGLPSDPHGVATVLSLLGDKTSQELGFDEDADSQNFLQITDKIRDIFYSLPSSGAFCLEKYSSRPHVPRHMNRLLQHLPLKRFCQRVYQEVQKMQIYINQLLLPIKRYLLNNPTFFLLRNEVFIPWLLILLGLFVYGIFMIVLMKQNADAGNLNYSLPLNADTYLAIGILIQSVIDVLEHNIRCLTPFQALRQGYQHPNILWRDYTCIMPLWEIFIAFQNEDYLMCFASLMTQATVVYTIFLGSLQLSSSYYGATSFNSDYTAATTSTILIGFVLVVNLSVWRVYVRKSQEFLVRPPDTLAGILPYVAWSKLLAEDLKSVADQNDVEEKIKKLENMERRYGFGVFTDENGRDRIGIERQFHDGPIGGSNIKLR